MDAVSQEIDKRVIKTFDTLDDANEYIKNIKNRVMMYNFPFAFIQEFTNTSPISVNRQYLYILDEEVHIYLAEDDLSMLTLSTRRKLHNFEDDVVFNF